MPYEKKLYSPKGTLRKPAGGNPWKNRTPKMPRPEVPSHYWRSDLSFDDEVSAMFRMNASSDPEFREAQPVSLYELIWHLDTCLLDLRQNSLGDISDTTDRDLFVNTMAMIGWACTATLVNLGWIKPSNGFGEVCPEGLIRPEPPFSRMPMPGEARRFVQSNAIVPPAHNFREAYGLVKTTANWVEAQAVMDSYKPPVEPELYNARLTPIVELYVVCWQVAESLGLVKENF